MARSSKLISSQLGEYEKAIQEAAQNGLLLDSQNEFPPVTEKWSIVQAIFFCSTVITSIGYGSLVPVTFKGRIFCMFYALIGTQNDIDAAALAQGLMSLFFLFWTTLGIPLTLTVIADWGKLFATAVSVIGKHLSG